MRAYFIPVLIGFVLLSCGGNDDSSFPDFSSCDCSPFPYDIVCGDDGRTYLDSCQALCMKVSIVGQGNCLDAFNDPNDTLKWPIEVVCIPVVKEGDPQEIRFLGDGSVLYQHADGSYFRGTQNLCRCLPPSSPITTPSGLIRIDQLNVGDELLVVGENGHIRIETVAHIRRVPSAEDHQIIRLLMDDGSKLEASALHPLASGLPINELRVGDCLGGKLVTAISMVKYREAFTWDLLPTGPDPVYLVDGVPLRSTIAGRGSEIKLKRRLIAD